jgi:hypothetical protein
MHEGRWARSDRASMVVTVGQTAARMATWRRTGASCVETRPRRPLEDPYRTPGTSSCARTTRSFTRPSIPMSATWVAGSRRYCPSCVPDPPDPCLKSQPDYSALRAQMLDKYGSVGCKNSSDCTLVLEDNACAAVCNVPVPNSMIDTLHSNLCSSAATYCGGCPKPASVLCAQMVPACMDGRCVAANTP